MERSVRIGCGAGFWGDSPQGPQQLVESGAIDYLVLDYLAEITMSILARMKAKDPQLGYATDFVTMVMKPLARQIAGRPEAEQDLRVLAHDEVRQQRHLVAQPVERRERFGDGAHARTRGATGSASANDSPGAATR